MNELIYFSGVKFTDLNMLCKNKSIIRCCSMALFIPELDQRCHNKSACPSLTELVGDNQHQQCVLLDCNVADGITELRL